MHIRESDRAIVSARQHPIAVGGPCQSVDRANMSIECLKLLAGVCLPDLDSAKTIGACQKQSVRTKCDGEDPIRVLPQRGNLLTTRSSKYLYRTTRSAQGNQTFVG